MTGCSQFITIPKHQDDLRYPPELLNLCSINLIQVFSEDELIVHFSHGKTRNYRGVRAQSLIQSLVLVGGN